MKDENKKRIKKLLKSNGLYFALALCFLSAGAVGMNNALNKIPGAISEGYSSPSYQYSSQENTSSESSKRNTVIIDIEEFTTEKYEEPSTAAVFDNNAPTVPSEEPSSEKTVIFSSPLSLTIGKDFSMGVPVFSETMRDYRTHNGVDFMGVRGENVTTVGEGVVVSVSSDSLWGNTVTIDHGNGIVSSISGLADEALIETGATLYSDTIIGVVGDIPVESSEGAHIHLEMRVNGVLTDPLEILGFASYE